MPSIFARQRLAISAAALKSAREVRSVDSSRLGSRWDGTSTTVQNVDSQQYFSGVKRDKITLEEKNMLVSFFGVSTGDPASGADRETRSLEISKTRWACELDAAYPSLLRRAAYLNPELLTRHQGGAHQKLTKFQASLRASVAQARQPHFDPMKERLDRFAAAQSAYALQLARKGSRLPPLSAEEKKEAADLVAAREILTASEFDP